jgi:hypothetical protein
MLHPCEIRAGIGRILHGRGGVWTGKALRRNTKVNIAAAARATSRR